MSLITKPLVEVNQHALRLLYDQLGVVDTVRFLKQFTTGFGSYTQQRESLFAGKSLSEIVREIEGQPKPPAT
jgi:hypothetical protein